MDSTERTLNVLKIQHACVNAFEQLMRQALKLISR